jgi:hypothetical protein
MRLAGAALALSGITGWCPGYHGAGLTSIDGPGDRPDEAHRQTWLGSLGAGARGADATLPQESSGAGDGE